MEATRNLACADEVNKARSRMRPVLKACMCVCRQNWVSSSTRLGSVVGNSRE